MSGGVDSSVAAALLLDAGYDVIGVTMEVYPGATAAADAQRVAGHLGIPFYRFSLEEAFAREVVEYFTGAYLQGLTPNPCVVCNRKIKFQALAEEARKLGAAYFATGHYVRKGYEPELDRFTLARGKDPKKDQSYVLFGLTQEQLAEPFPLGGYERKRSGRWPGNGTCPAPGRPRARRSVSSR